VTVKIHGVTFEEDRLGEMAPYIPRLRLGEELAWQMFETCHDDGDGWRWPATLAANFALASLLGRAVDAFPLPPSTLGC
jgi:hypothetical protein